MLSNNLPVYAKLTEAKIRNVVIYDRYFRRSVFFGLEYPQYEREDYFDAGFERKNIEKTNNCKK